MPDIRKRHLPFGQRPSLGSTIRPSVTASLGRSRPSANSRAAFCSSFPGAGNAPALTEPQVTTRASSRISTSNTTDTTTRMLMEESNIWAVMLRIDGWGEPVMLGRSINTEGHYENYPAVTNDKSIYYMSRREGGYGRADVHRSRNDDGVYMEAENLGEPVNTAGSDADPFIAPDESYLIVCQKKDEGFGEYDLYAAFRKPDETWSVPVNLGEGVNSRGYEFRPYVTPDGKYLFFTSSRDPRGIYWVDARVIDEVKPDALK